MYFMNPPAVAAPLAPAGGVKHRAPRHARSVLVVGALCFACVGPVAHAVDQPVPPNFIVILADDLGWRDLGCYGNAFHETPHLDRLARHGMRFTQAYAACCVCSPTRA